MSRRGAPPPRVPGAWTTPPQRNSPESAEEESPPHTPDGTRRRSKGVDQEATWSVARDATGVANARDVAAADRAHDRHDSHVPNHDLHTRHDSHDLSWSPQRQRLSVLENMLLSLDHAAGMEPLTRNGAPTAEAAHPASHRYTFSTPPRHRERSGTADTVSSAASGYHSMNAESPSRKARSHRSNSSITFQTPLGRIDSVRTVNGAKEEPATFNPGDALIATPKASASAAGAVASSAPRRSSRGSGTSSVDLGPPPMAQWQRSTKRRSRSFDHSYLHSDPFAQFQRPSFQFSSPEDQATATAIYDSLEAAPMPTVPGGPRRPGDSVPGSPGVATDEAERRSRRGTMRSPMEFFSRTERSQSPKRGGPRPERAERPSNLRHGSSYEDRQQTDQMDLADGVRPSLGSATVSAPVFATSAQRPSFFRRVFSSGTKSIPIQPEPPLPLQVRAMSESVPSDMPAYGGHGDNSFSDGSLLATPSPGDIKRFKKPEKDKEPPPPLNKKSSFFRRRKKSTPQAMPVPEIPPQFPDLPTSKSISEGMDARPGSLQQALDLCLARPTDLNGELLAQSSSETPQIIGDGARTTIRSVQRPEEVALVVSDSPRLTDSANRDRALRRDGRFPEAGDRERASVDIATERSIRDSFARASITPRARNSSEMDKSLPHLPPMSRQENAISTSPRSPATPSKSRKPSTDPLSSIANTITMLAAGAGLDGTESDASVSSKAKRNSVSNRPRPQLVLASENAKLEASNPPRPPLNSPAVQDQLRLPSPRGSISEGEASGYMTSSSKPDSPSELARLTASQESATATTNGLNTPVLDTIEPSDEDREQAKKLFNGTGGIDRGEAAAWLGEEGAERATIRMAYMQLFDWSNISILAAMRSFCAQTRLKGETQQVDRILDSLSARWCECNPNHGFKATDVVHTICYSILLLNTDLHMANIDQKMTRTQFIRNTMPTIQRVVADAAPDAFQEARSTALLPPSRAPPAPPSEGSSAPVPKTAEPRRPPLTHRPSNQSDSEVVSSNPGTPGDGGEFPEACGPLVNVPFTGKQAAWELQVELVLKNFFNAIRQERLPLFGSDDVRATARSQPSSNSLSAMGGSALRRSNSLVSKAGSENIGARGRLMDGRLGMGMGSRWSSKTRSRPRLYPPSSSHGLASRTSVDDDGASAISPSASSMWSRVSFGRTQASMSVNSLAVMPPSDFQQSIGFANALSQAIIREETTGDGEDSLRVRPLLEDESLELAGAPWAKEGIVKHKHHLESVDKKAKDRSWVECFAVVEKGWVRLFQFNVNARSMRNKARGRQIAGGVVGGGNWTENAEPLGSYLLRQAIATALPPPGYSKTRPNVWALSLPNGAVHLFQVGTPEIVREFVSTANYWSARMSKEPLVGGVSNIEYGWSDAVVNLALVSQQDASRPSISQSRPSVQSSVRGSIDQGSTTRPRLPADRIHISDWAPHMQSTMPSQLMEVDQLRALGAYVANIEQELKRHNDLRGPMQLAFTPRQPNYNKAMTNWERKSAYLLQEIVKFSTYIESLKAAQTQQDKIYAERDEREQEKARNAAATAAAEEASTAVEAA